MNNSEAHSHGLKDWAFDDPENVAAICCAHVLEGTRPILRVTHDEDDGCWQILCGSDHNDSDGRVVCLGCMVRRDLSLVTLSDLPLGWCADRESPDQPWVRSINPPEGAQ
jgi:hypothetical protein